MLGAWYSRGAVALLIALAAVVPRPAQAAISASCADLRNKIVTMENAVPSGAAASVDLGMRRVYNEDCLRHPSDGQTPASAASDPWFDAKGDPASGPPPDGNGVFQTTPQIAGYCQGSSDPQLCALMLNIGEGKMLTEGGDPKDPNDWVPPTRDIDPADALPPFRLSAGGRTFPIDDACLSGLASLLVPQRSADTAIATRLSGPQCAEELGAIGAALGPLENAIAQWRAAALRDPTMQPDANGNLQPAFRAMCSQAFNNQNICRQRQKGMITAGTIEQPGTVGQAGSFGACADLYGSVVAMCRQAGLRFPATPRTAALSPSTANKPHAKKLPPPNRDPAPPKDATGGSSAPPKQTPAQAMAGQMPTSCGPAMQKYLDDVGSKQSGGAVNSYQQLASSDECRDAMKRIADANSLALPERKMTPLTRNAFGAAFGKDPNAPLAVPTPVYAGSSGGGDVDPEQVLEFGIALLNLGIGAANLANAMHGAGAVGGVAFPTTNYNSLAGPIIRNGIGQGSPGLRPPPVQRQIPPCVGGPTWCSAQ